MTLQDLINKLGISNNRFRHKAWGKGGYITYCNARDIWLTNYGFEFHLPLFRRYLDEEWELLPDSKEALKLEKILIKERVEKELELLGA